MLKFFGYVGLVGTVVVFYLVTYGVGEERQLPPSVSLLEGFREDGFLPESRNLPDDHAGEDTGAFEVPAQDGVVYEAALEAMGDMDMSGMDMSGMDMDGADGAMAGMDMAGGDAVLDMDMDGDGVMDMSSADMGNMSNMNMDGAGNTMAGMDMAGGEAVLDMDMDGDGVMDMSSADMGNMSNMNMDGADNAMAGMDMAESDDAMAGMNMSPSAGALMGEGGILITSEGDFDRVVDLTMTEWGYSDMQLDVTRGERIKLVVTNDGEIPHEFMFMDMALMAAANYRITRADWSLLEHEALFEKALILPGGSFEIIIEVQQAGSWMYMCMLPYHMQLGMMGQMATEGAAMDMAM